MKSLRINKEIRLSQNPNLLEDKLKAISKVFGLYIQDFLIKIYQIDIRFL